MKTERHKLRTGDLKKNWIFFGRNNFLVPKHYHYNLYSIKSVSFFLVFIILLSLHADSTAEPPKAIEILLVDSKKPVSSIVISCKANRSARFAAAELQYHIKKITGVRLPIVNDSEIVKGTRILVGESKITETLGLRNCNFKHQEYLIKFLPDMLILMGKDKEDVADMDYGDFKTFPGQFDEQATCYAVYDFLEKYCDIRWYLPTELGLVYSLRETLSVEGTIVRRSPSMKYRMLWYDAAVPVNLYDSSNPSGRLDEREGLLFVSRQRLRGIEPFIADHSFTGYYSAFLKEHPDWFAKGYDKDLHNAPIDYDYRNMCRYYPQLCYTNSDLIQQVIKSARYYFDKGQILIPKEKGKGNYFCIAPNDNYQYCRCPECQTLLHSPPPCSLWRKQDFFWNDAASDYIFGFANKVAKEIHKSHPDKYLSIFAYNDYYYPPTKEALEPNIAIMLCFYPRLCVCPAMKRARNEYLKKWADESKTRPKFAYFYFHRPAANLKHCFPGFMAHDMVKQMQYYHDIGLCGIYIEPSWCDFSKLGKERMRRPIMDQLELYVIFKLADDPTLDGNKLIDEFFERYYGSASKPMQMLYEKIEQTYSDPANYSFNTKYLGYQTLETAWGKLGTPERMSEFETLMKKAKAMAKTEVEEKRVLLFEKSIWEYMKAGQQDYKDYLDTKCKMLKKQESFSFPSSYLVKTTNALAAGNPRKLDWSKAEIINKWFLSLNGEVTPSQLEARIMHDGLFLYIQLRKMMDITTLFNCANWRWYEHYWELYMATDRNEKNGYCQMVINANGTHRELAHGEKTRNWTGGAKVISDSSSSDCWTVYIVLPMNPISQEGIQPGQTIYLNILHRTLRFPGGISEGLVSWIPTFAEKFRKPYMGSIQLEKYK